MQYRIYYPYPATDKTHKYFIITSSGKKIRFGAKGYEDYTTHGDDIRKQNYIARHQKREDWTKSGLDTKGFWSFWLLWNKPSIQESYEDIKQRFLM